MFKYIKSILIGFLSIIFFYIMQFIGSSIFLICNFKNPLNYIRFLNHINVSPNETAKLILSGDIFIVIVVLLIIFNFKNLKLKKEFKLKSFKLKKLLVIVPLGIGIALFFSIFSNLLLRMCNIPISSTVKTQNQMNSIYAYLAIILIGPIAEELVFRGFLFNYLDKITSRVYAIILSSIFFAIGHGDYSQGLYVVFLGVGLAFIYTYTNSIYGNITLHIVANSTGYLLLFLEKFLTFEFGKTIATNIIGVMYIFYGLIFLLTGIYIYKKLERKENRNRYLIVIIILIISSIITFLTTI